MSENSKTIQFIDSDYRELFRIPDGGSIKITYPPGDGRDPVTRACKYRDDYHFETLGRGGDSYHIAQFAEIMERLGARYEPEVQLRDAELVPFLPGEEKYFTYNREEGNTCIGHLSGDFGNDGERFNSSWKGRENDRNTPEFQAELHPAVYALRQSVLKDYDSMLAHCDSHPEAKLDSGDNYKRYGFKLETDTRQYFVNCFFGEYMRDARFNAYAYDKAAPVLEQAQSAAEQEARFGVILPGTADESKFFYRNNEDGNLCIGYLRGDFGRQGNEFWHNWFENDSGRKTPEFQAEFQTVMDTLRWDVLKDYKSSADYCSKHPETVLPDSDGNRYGFKLETESRNYFVRCTTLRDDYFYVFAYDKAAPVHEQEKENKQVYLHSEDIARENGELDLYRESLSLNMACALAIEDVIGRRYEANGYQYNPADIKGLIDKFWQERVLAVLAHTVRETDDGRFSRSNRDWANEFSVLPRSKHASFTVSGHPAIVDGFIDQVRKPSVLDQIRTARKEQKQPSALKPERDKKQRGPEL